MTRPGLKTKRLKVDDLWVKVLWKDIKHMYLRVKPVDEVHVTAPPYVSLKQIEGFVRKRKRWVRKWQKKIKAKPFPLKNCLEDGQKYLFLGRTYRVCIKRAKGARAEIRGEQILLQIPQDASPILAAELFLNLYSSHLKKILEGLLPIWQERLGTHVNRLTIKVMKSRWGSASARTKRISICLDIVRFSKEFIEYVLVHEMAHFFERNHGPGFKAFMDESLPGWRALDKELRKQSPILYNLKYSLSEQGQGQFKK